MFPIATTTRVIAKSLTNSNDKKSRQYRAPPIATTFLGVAKKNNVHAKNSKPTLFVATYVVAIGPDDSFFEAKLKLV